MLKKVASKVAWVGRTASMVFGLALVLALMFGVASMALAGTGVGGVFNLGVTNTVNALTKLTGSVAGPSLQIDNNSTNTAATALDLQVEPNKPPMKVNSQTKVTNLNADKIDGKDSSAFVPTSRAPMWVVVNSTGTIARKSPEVISAERYCSFTVPTCLNGVYLVTFNRDVSQCAYAATIYNPQLGLINAGPRSDSFFDPRQVQVVTSGPSGEGPRATTFHLIVTC
jgi:hypothetical protein